jgi:hypothetical protein
VLKLLVPTETRVQKTLVSNKNRTMHNPFLCNWRSCGNHIDVISWPGNKIANTAIIVALLLRCKLRPLDTTETDGES